MSPPLLQMPQVVTKEGGSDVNLGSGGNISVIDIHTSTNKPGGEPPKVSMTSEAQSKLSKQLTSGLASMKPILPKPAGSMGGMPGLPTSLSFTATGHGPQGPTVNVQHLIAAHRKENPNTPPIRYCHCCCCIKDKLDVVAGLDDRKECIHAKGIAVPVLYYINNLYLYISLFYKYELLFCQSFRIIH